MSSSNQPLRYDSENSKDLVLYLNTKTKLNPIKQRDFSLFFVYWPSNGNSQSSCFQKIVNLSVCLVKIMVKWKGLENG